MNLENKKKKELIEIILRKDAVEEQLRDNVKKHSDEIIEQSVRLDAICKDYTEANAKCYVLEKRIEKLKKRNKVWFAISIVTTFAALLAVML